jgi:cyclophilin family peptidyl-prolyl cis-trans isomerase
MFDDGHFLNGQYTVWGRVVSGMEHVDAITRGEPPRAPDRMRSRSASRVTRDEAPRISRGSGSRWGWAGPRPSRRRRRTSW